MGQVERQLARGSVARRGVLAGVAAVVAGALAKASQRVASAADGGSLILGSTANQANGETTLTRGAAGPTPTTGFALHVYSTVAAVYGESNFIGVEGISYATTPGGVGVAGVAGSVASNNQPKAGVRGSALDYLGVYGESQNASGVVGVRGGGSVPAGYFAGVLGAVPAGVTGVQGIADSPGPVPPQGTAGVGGTSSTGYGVVGSSASNIGAYGLSTSGSGVLGQSNSGVGVQGSSNGNVGVLGTSGTSVGVYASSSNQYGLYATSPNTYAAIGTSNGGTGVYGSSNGNVGVLGTSNSSIGVYGSSSSGTGIYGTGPAAGFAARFDGPVQVSGAFTVIGGPKSAAVPHPDGSHRRLYCVESPESWFEDFGGGQLANGRAQVRLDPDFAALVQGDKYHVFVTEYEDQGGLFVTSVGARGFEVRARTAGASGAFSYRVVAKRRDIAGPRLERVAVATPSPRPAAPTSPPPVPVVDSPRLDPNAVPAERQRVTR
jgi:hypothetical protein